MIYFCVVYFHVIFFHVVLRLFHYLRQILMINIWQLSGKAIKKKLSLGVGQLGLIQYLVIFVCLFRKHLSMIKLNCMLLLLLISLILSLHKETPPIRFSIEFHFQCHYIIKYNSLSFITFNPHHLF